MNFLTIRDPYAGWCNRESGRPPTYVYFGAWDPDPPWRDPKHLPTAREQSPKLRPNFRMGDPLPGTHHFPVTGLSGSNNLAELTRLNSRLARNIDHSHFSGNDVEAPAFHLAVWKGGLWTGYRDIRLPPSVVTPPRVAVAICR